MTRWPLRIGVAVVVAKLVLVICALWMVTATARAEEGRGAAQSADTIAIAPASASDAAASTVTKSGTVAEFPATGATAQALTPAPLASSPATSPAPKTALQQAVFEIKATTADLARLSAIQRRKWQTAVASLPSFCEDWNRMLHDREVENLLHLQWHQAAGYQTATYTGYGTVQGCQAKESAEGVPIGKVTYQELSYYLVGKSVDDAKAHPRLLGKTQTLEIFSYEKDRWFY
ncbi:MAG TPA: hypothetical protein VKS22_07015 [Candidatus Binataceae bacterium]|nr:hypothetical protein [Candidatus Binataceae bacterium]